ncbi:MAG: terminase small subunit [Chloroflexota bacterium]
MARGEINEKQRQFVQEYLIDLNATQAAVRAGYSAKTAEQIGYQLLQKTSVAEAVARAKAERSARIGLTADRVLEELAAVAFARMPEFMEWGGENGQMKLKPSEELTGHQAAAISQVVETEKFIKTIGEDEQLMSRERSIKLHDKVSALVKLGQHIGMFADKRTVTLEIKREAEALADELGIPYEQVLKEAGITEAKR